MIESVLQLLRKGRGQHGDHPLHGRDGHRQGLFAQVVHEISHRRDRPFVQVNCAALPTSCSRASCSVDAGRLHRRGQRQDRPSSRKPTAAPSSSTRSRRSRERADEAAARARPRQIRPSARRATSQRWTRAICATSATCATASGEGRFLEDLYYRLNDITVRACPRCAREDIAAARAAFPNGDVRAAQMDKNLRGFAPEVMAFSKRLARQRPRTRKRPVKRMVVLADDGAELIDLFSFDVLDARPAAPCPAGRARAAPRCQQPPVAGARSVIGRPLLERKVIAEALERLRGNKARVARARAQLPDAARTHPRLRPRDRRASGKFFRHRAPKTFSPNFTAPDSGLRRPGEMSKEIFRHSRCDPRPRSRERRSSDSTSRRPTNVVAKCSDLVQRGTRGLLYIVWRGTSKQVQQTSLDQPSGLAGSAGTGRGYEPRPTTTHQFPRPIWSE